MKFCRELKYYMSEELIEDKSTGMNYPVGSLGRGDMKITIYFMHYDNFTQAKEKWEQRKTRIHWDNLYFIMNGGDNCPEETAREFDTLPYEHKAFLTFGEYNEMKSAIKFKAVKNSTGPKLFMYRSVLQIGHVIDDWDYVSFFNS